MEIIARPPRKVKTDKIGLIDADTFKYRITASIMRNIDKNPVYAEVDYLGKEIEKGLSYVTDFIDAKGFIFCFSGLRVRNFRYNVAFDREYKGNRKNQEGYPKYESDKKKIEEALKQRFPSLLFPELEADDILCMLQDKDTFIFSEDKDLLQVPGTHYNIETGDFIEVSKEDAFMSLMRQLLEGDVVDNVLGLKSYGSVRTQELLTNIPVKKLPYEILKKYLEQYGIVNGIDSFVEAWNLLKLRENRGEYFREKYARAFDLLELLKES